MQVSSIADYRMAVKHDGTITLATGRSRMEKNWKNMPFPKSAEYICDSEELDTEGEITITPDNNEE